MRIEITYINGKPYTIKGVSSYTTSYDNTNFCLHVTFKDTSHKTYKNIMSIKVFSSGSISIEYNTYIKNLSIKTDITTNKIEAMRIRDLNSENPINLINVDKARKLKHKVYSIAKYLGYKNEKDLKETLEKLGVTCGYEKYKDCVYYFIRSKRHIWRDFGFNSKKEFETVLTTVLYKQFSYSGDDYHLCIDLEK